MAGNDLDSAGNFWNQLGMAGRASMAGNGYNGWEMLDYWNDLKQQNMAENSLTC